MLWRTILRDCARGDKRLSYEDTDFTKLTSTTRASDCKLQCRESSMGRRRAGNRPAVGAGARRCRCWLGRGSRVRVNRLRWSTSAHA